MTTNQHAAPWTMKRIMQMLAPAPRRRPPTDLMTGREALARMLFSEHVNGSTLDLLDYDHSPQLQTLWLAEADIYLSVSKEDRLVSAHHGIPVGEWIRMSALAKVDHREQYAKETRMAA